MPPTARATRRARGRGEGQVKAYRSDLRASRSRGAAASQQCPSAKVPRGSRSPSLSPPACLSHFLLLSLSHTHTPSSSLSLSLPPPPLSLSPRRLSLLRCAVLCCAVRCARRSRSSRMMTMSTPPEMRSGRSGLACESAGYTFAGRTFTPRSNACRMPSSAFFSASFHFGRCCSSTGPPIEPKRMASLAAHTSRVASGKCTPCASYLPT
eukprot:4399126-Prymnesium_polylepis.2